jgi:hypothetical protein
VPDALCGLKFADDTASFFMVEADRGGIPLRRTDTHGTAAWRKNMAYKFLTYFEGWKAGRHVEQFGLKQMRVLTVTSSVTRMENMLTVLDEVTEHKGSAFFLFTDRETLARGNPLEIDWINGRREKVRLTD